MTSVDVENPSLERLIEVTEQVIDEEPLGRDFIYDSGDKVDSDSDMVRCYYVRDGKPDCIAARIFAKLGVSLGTLRASENVRAPRIAGNVWGWSHFDPRSDFLFALQRKQDTQHPWGEAFDFAKEVAAGTKSKFDD